MDHINELLKLTFRAISSHSILCFLLSLSFDNILLSIDTFCETTTVQTILTTSKWKPANSSHGNCRILPLILLYARCYKKYLSSFLYFFIFVTLKCFISQRQHVLRVNSYPKNSKFHWHQEKKYS